MRFYRAFKICSAQKIWEIYGLKLCWAKNCNKSEMKNATESYPIIRIIFIRKLQSLRRKKSEKYVFIIFCISIKILFRTSKEYLWKSSFMKFITKYLKFHFSRLIAEWIWSSSDENKTRIVVRYIYVVLENAMKWEKMQVIFGESLNVSVHLFLWK